MIPIVKSYSLCNNIYGFLFVRLFLSFSMAFRRNTSEVIKYAGTCMSACIKYNGTCMIQVPEFVFAVVNARHEYILKLKWRFNCSRYILQWMLHKAKTSRVGLLIVGCRYLLFKTVDIHVDNHQRNKTW